MTRDEFERNRRRFGDTVEAWPAPFRQQALAFMADEAPPEDDPDAALDRLVLEATLIEGDDQALARKVLARIDTGSARPRPCCRASCWRRQGWRPAPRPFSSR